MPSHASRTRRSYDQFCAIARALDSVGDRWALLIVRELLAGPRRYTDLHADLPGVSTDVLASRLRLLESEGLAERRRQPRPASAYVYELTPRGSALLPVLSALAAWGGLALGKPRATDAVRAHWWAVPLRDALRRAAGPEAAEGAVVDVVLPEGGFHLHLGDGEKAPGSDPAPGSASGPALGPVPGPVSGPVYGEGRAPRRADAELALDSAACTRLAEGTGTLAEEISAGAIRITGEGPLADRLREPHRGDRVR
ncbi:MULTISPECIES: helix-turn-helix domain-containing protein [unclassified Streptomyces]|uniref:winged helix-turn-helix transcriptional regulator n=1 Tax=unclassified Streptomyces TaxID=2593676 RepID=UPI002DD94405|nr:MULTISPECIES: helix-turn-helix domain-containing protein [unclassified Streptomyces]WSB77130.1 helix-turn-helix transcriptional regulator [Streptomyces sp. NBC_01775]WSS14605.1 helix-turn-helix transcriptional regulator [Streptomyces sp. NBC_01186]WSS43419.1 helix-turn-helix transcriptional regulator [Streptomyces sp. NBC_01187]